MEDNHPAANELKSRMHSIQTSLQGGDRRSIGKSGEVVARVLKEPELFGELMSGIGLDDPLVRMRCADAAEKISAIHPDWLQPYKRKLLGELANIEQQEVRWHVAAMLVRLKLSAVERKCVVELLLSWTNDRSSIVKTLSMQALADIALQDAGSLPEVRKHIEELCIIGTPAMKARGKKLLVLFDRRHDDNE